MKIAIMQPYLFPYIGYFQLIYAVDKFVIYDDVQYIKGGWINRNKILLNNAPYLFTFGVKKGSTFSNINERYFSNKFVQDKFYFFSLLKTAYQKAPFYSETIDVLESALSFSPMSNLAECIFYTIKVISNYLDIKTEFVISSRIEKDPELKGQDRVISILEALNGTEYINAIGGQELYSKEVFKKKKLNLFFLNTHPIKYNQQSELYIPNLSIIDLMMFNSSEEIKTILGEYSLK